METEFKPLISDLEWAVKTLMPTPHFDWYEFEQETGLAVRDIERLIAIRKAIK